MTTVAWYTLTNWANTGSDVVCADCLPAARADQPQTVLAGPFTSSGGDGCSYCGRDR